MQMSFWLSLVSTEYNICKPKPRNDFCEIGILSQSQISPFSNPRTTARGKCCKEHFFFILSRNLIGQRETKVIRSQFTISSAQVHRFPVGVLEFLLALYNNFTAHPFQSLWSAIGVKLVASHLHIHLRTDATPKWDVLPNLASVVVGSFG